MGVFEMVVVIVVIGCVTSSIDNWVKHKAKAEKNSAQDGEIVRLKAEISDLQDRMQVMEKLATDGDAHLREAFKKLA
ncbi:MAG: hypothetical protein ABJG15_15060 [Hyphomonadaceae bacterium]